MKPVIQGSFLCIYVATSYEEELNSLIKKKYMRFPPEKKKLLLAGGTINLYKAHLVAKD